MIQQRKENNHAAPSKDIQAKQKRGIGIDENISTYYARHSYASVLKLKGEDIDVELPDRCIGELRGDPLYADILETERQYVDYRNKNGG